MNWLLSNHYASGAQALFVPIATVYQEWLAHVGDAPVGQLNAYLLCVVLACLIHMTAIGELHDWSA